MIYKFFLSKEIIEWMNICQYVFLLKFEFFFSKRKYSLERMIILRIRIENVKKIFLSETKVILSLCKENNGHGNITSLNEL